MDTVAIPKATAPKSTAAPTTKSNKTIKKSDLPPDAILFKIAYTVKGYFEKTAKKEACELILGAFKKALGRKLKRKESRVFDISTKTHWIYALESDDDVRNSGLTIIPVKQDEDRTFYYMA